MIRVDGAVIRLEGHCPVEEAEQLLEMLQGGVSAALDLSACGSVHTAILQVLLASRMRILIAPADALLASLLPATCGSKSAMEGGAG